MTKVKSTNEHDRALGHRLTLSWTKEQNQYNQGETVYLDTKIGKDEEN